MGHSQRQRGTIIPYIVISMTVLIGLCSLAVDLGRVEAVKTDLRRCADAVARGYLELYAANSNSQSVANSNGPSLYSSANNPVDQGSGVSPTVSVTWGFWTPTSSTFSTSSGTYTAIKVTCSRTAANNNAINLNWGAVIGKPTCDVSVTSIACVIGSSQTVSFNTPANADPYLAGATGYETASVDDNTSNAAAYKVPSLTVTPGSYLTFTSLTGTLDGGPYWSSLAGEATPAGYSGYTTSHTPAGGENGIGDANAPMSSLMGVFLQSDAPTNHTTPSYIDWTTSSNANQPVYNSLLTQQPFLVGAGVTTGGAVQQFLVPSNANRLYLCGWDGYEWNNNGGSFQGTVTVVPVIQIVQ